MSFKIFPPIGFARLGDSPDFIIARERLGVRETEITAGGEAEVARYKDDNLRVKRAAARFRIFEFPDDGSEPRPVDLSDGTTIEWTVHLVNRKNGVQRGGTPPSAPTLPQPVANPGPVTINPGTRSVSGANAGGQSFDSGSFLGTNVPLGELRTDSNQHLLVLGGRGFSSSPNGSGMNSFYSNSGWHDDTSDGPVTARLVRPDGSVVDGISPAWAVVGPPDFAPDVEGMVTLYDIIRQVGIDAFGLQMGAISFARDVFPLLRRTSMLQWVNSAPEWTDMDTDWAALSDNSSAASGRRRDAATVVRRGERVLSRHELTAAQRDILVQYENGQFDSDWNGVPQSATITPNELTRVALDSTVGQGFYPGIEAGIVTRNTGIYASPFEFRLNHAALNPGDLTALMAVPWQADFLACDDDWWPSQRPNQVETGAAFRQDWARGIGNYQEMVDKSVKLGFIVAQTDAAGNVIYVEDQRAPNSEF